MTLTSLAILKVNFDQKGQDFIDLFVPFAVEALRAAGRPGANSLAVRAALTGTFGITIPEGAVTSVLKRGVRQGLVDARGHGAFALTDAGEALPDLTVARDDASRQQAELVRRLGEFSSNHLASGWTLEEAEAALIRFAATRGAKVLARQESAVSATSDEARDETHVLGEFVVYLKAGDPAGYAALEALIKGALLASAMYYPDLGRLHSRFTKLEVLLDTRLVLRALGTAGPEQEEAARQLLELLYELGATLGVFDATFREVRNVLGAASAALRQSSRLREGSGETLEYLAAQGYRSSDVELIIATLDRRLRALRVGLRQRPRQVERLGVDEAELERLLRSGSQSRRPYAEEALRHDIDAVTAIHRMRDGVPQPVLESARAVFLTTNALLARVAADFFGDHYGAVGVPVCYVDHQLATLAWLKKPTAAPALPMLQVMADSYAALNPPEGLWRAYLSEIARLEAKGDITAEDYYSLRFTMAGKSALLDTVGPRDHVEGTIPEILARTQAVMRAEVTASVEAAATTKEVVHAVELAVARRELELERQRREARFHDFAARIGRVVASGVLFAGASAVAVITYLGLSGFLPMPDLPWLLPFRPLLYIAAFFCLVLGIANLVFGTSVQSLSRRVEVRVTRRVDGWLRARFL